MTNHASAGDRHLKMFSVGNKNMIQPQLLKPVALQCLTSLSCHDYGDSEEYVKLYAAQKFS